MIISSSATETFFCANLKRLRSVHGGLIEAAGQVHGQHHFKSGTSILRVCPTPESASTCLAAASSSYVASVVLASIVASSSNARPENTHSVMCGASRPPEHPVTSKITDLHTQQGRLPVSVPPTTDESVSSSATSHRRT